MNCERCERCESVTGKCECTCEENYGMPTIEEFEEGLAKHIRAVAESMAERMSEKFIRELEKPPTAVDQGPTAVDQGHVLRLAKKIEKIDQDIVEYFTDPGNFKTEK